jgi:hypothetical protein
MSDALRDARSRLGTVNSAQALIAARPGPIHHQRRRGRMGRAEINTRRMTR